MIISEFTQADFDRAEQIANAADQGGVIQADAMVALCPGEPQRHCTTMLRRAWGIEFQMDDEDLDKLSEALWA